MYEKITGFRRTEENSEIVTKAFQQFEPKPFLEEYKELYKLSHYFRWVLGSLSIFTGVLFLSQSFAQLGLYISLSISLLVFSVIEILKSTLLSKTAFLLLKKSNQVVFVAPISGLLLALSVFSSFEGTKSLYQLTDKEEVTITHVYQSKLDSITRHFQYQIESQEQQLSAYKNQVSYLGKINISNQTNREVIRSYQEEISQLKNELRQEKSGLKADFDLNIQDLRQNQYLHSNTWKGLAILTEFLICTLLFFRTWYKFQVYQEHKALMIQYNLPNPFEAKQQYEQVLEKVLIKKPYYDRSSTRNKKKTSPKPKLAPIKGFTVSGAGNSSNTQTETKKSTKSVANIASSIEEKKMLVWKLLEEGICDRRILCKKAKLNVLMINELCNQYYDKFSTSTI